MKKDSKIKTAKKYAAALYDAGITVKDAEQLSLLESDSAFVKSFSNPIWAKEDKYQALDEIAIKIGLNDRSVNALKIIIENNHVGSISDILREYQTIHYQKNNITEVFVETVKPLKPAQDKQLQANLEKKLNKKVLINYEIKPEILGGLVLKFDSKIIDDSIQGKLTRLGKMMKGV